MDEQSEWSVVAKELKTTPDGARMKVQRVLVALTKNLGGFRPFYDSDKVTDE
jgi:hypothetical protein